jgi:2-dehydropantoate 2-reductase
VRILIAGTGGVGGYYGGRLAAAGNEVTFLARGAMLEALHRNGLEVRAELGDVRLPDVTATDRIDPGTRPAEGVLFVVKSYDNADAADAIAPAVGPGTIVCSLQNGVDNEAFLGGRFPDAPVIGGTSRIETFVARPGVVEQHGRQSELTVGAFTAGEQPAAERLGAVVGDAGVPVTVTDDVRAALWLKLVVITGLGGVTAFARGTIGEVLGDPELDRLFRDVLAETEAVAHALGVGIPPGLADTVHAYAEHQLAPDFSSSMARDVERGKPLEIESLNGAVVRYGEETGVATPANRRVVDALLPAHLEALAGRRVGGAASSPSVGDAAGEPQPT